MKAPTLIQKLISAQDSALIIIKRCDEKIRAPTDTEMTLGTVRAYLYTLNDTWKDVKEADSQIRRQVEPEHTYITSDLFGKIQDAYLQACGYLQGLNINALRNNPTETTIERSRSPRSEPDVLVKLPKIELPSFSGAIEEWESFRDAFTTLIDSRPGLNDASRFYYLKSCLIGEAANHVKDVATTHANYSDIWQRLQRRYDNPLARAHKLVSSLFNLGAIKATGAEIRKYADETQRILWSMDKLDDIVIYRSVMVMQVLARNLDKESRMLWEVYVTDREDELVKKAESEKKEVQFKDRAPKYAEFHSFLVNRAQALDRFSEAHSIEKSTGKSAKANTNAKRVHTSVKKIECRLCKEAHPLWKCPTLRSQSVPDRFTTVRKLHLCYNCLGDHYGSACSSTRTCKQCSRKHHTLLHNEDMRKRKSGRGQVKTDKQPAATTLAKSADLPHTTTSTSGIVPAETPVAIHTHFAHPAAFRCTTILATACVKASNNKRKSTKVRALLDQGSEVSFVSESLVNLLGLHRRRIHVPLLGIGDKKSETARGIVRLKIGSYVMRDFDLEIEAYVLPRLTGELPSRTLVELEMSAFKDLILADPTFGKTGPIDMILGVDVYGQLLRPGLQQISGTMLFAQNTALGWVVSGRSSDAREDGVSGRAVSEIKSKLRVLHCSTDNALYDVLKRFWEIEEPAAPSRVLSSEDERCEQLFADTHTRDEVGRFVVRLPLRDEPPQAAAETYRMSLGSLRHLHRKLTNDPQLNNEYIKFLAEYERLGHMERVPREETNMSRAWYLPHHAVRSVSGKIRVVFDASRKLGNERCLNDFLLPGPPLQSELPLILTNWRQHKIVFTADIVKMFRQIRIAKQDRDLHRIVWAENNKTEPIIYRLNTVTYGTSCAPYLAIRTLKQLAGSEESRFPLGAMALRNSIYVDDVFEGADTLDLALEKERELVAVLKTAGMELGKWAANHDQLLPAEVVTGGPKPTKRIDIDQTVKTLGVLWNSEEDNFNFSFQFTPENQNICTKRIILSNIARFFDPLGWLSPLTINAKILMQDLCIDRLDWDTPLTELLRQRWLDYSQSMTTVHTIKIQRWLGTAPDQHRQLHGFCDASKRAFAANVYLRIKHAQGNHSVELLTAKTKVSPIKTKSIPNLELCGAVLLVQLIKQMRKLPWLSDLEVFLWTDNETVLAWLNKHPCHWKTFVANRISLIQTELPSAVWSHVPTGDNPADIATRGTSPRELRKSDLWWHGPTWLLNEKEHWPRQKATVNVLTSRKRFDENELFTQISSFTRLVRFFARGLIWLERASKRKAGLPVPSMRVTVDLLNQARARIFRIVQSKTYSNEIALLRAGESLPKGNNLIGLRPFVDKNDGLLRVGGRLSHARIGYEQKYPPILPHESIVSRLLVRFAHQRALHGGPTLTASVLLHHAWIPTRTRLIKTELRACVVCQRAKPNLATQLMGDLPRSRLTPERPFTVSGVDYAGPFQVRMSKGRGQRSTKAYIALFVCFCTKAVHLELVSDLSSTAFIAAFRRFVSRRGICRVLYSDNATNYKGADRELKSMFTTASKFYNDVNNLIINDGTTWKFIPPSTPHCGGLWEAGIKSVKHHLRRTIGQHSLTFEEFTTLLTEIEACLNSRPLSPLSTDPEDLQALTPAFFLTGTTSCLIPEPESSAVPISQLRRYQLTTRLRNQLWTRWSNEYMCHLQGRSKWRGVTENFKVGQLVLIKDDRYPPSKWPLGRVIETFPGADGLIRVVTVKTASTTLKRHIACLAPLYIEETQTAPVNNNNNTNHCTTDD